MSKKSILQLILFFLIIILIGSTYFLYFYKGQENKYKINNDELSQINKLEKGLKDPLDEAILDENLNEEKLTSKINEIKEKNKYDLNKSLKKGENLTKEIEYVTTNKNGDILKIFANYGKTNIKNSNILNLEGVAGVFSSLNRSQINITSDFAEYNYKNQNSKFFEKVKINFDNKIINCDNLDLNMSENIAVAYNNVIIVDNNSTMKAQKITMNIETKDISINSNDKIKISTN